jgi:hypothetical protein
MRIESSWLAGSTYAYFVTYEPVPTDYDPRAEYSYSVGESFERVLQSISQKSPIKLVYALGWAASISAFSLMPPTRNTSL